MNILSFALNFMALLILFFFINDFYMRMSGNKLKLNKAYEKNPPEGEVISSVSTHDAYVADLTVWSAKRALLCTVILAYPTYLDVLQKFVG